MTDWKEFPRILENIMSGNQPLPNYVPLDATAGIATIACGAGLDPTTVRRAREAVDGKDTGYSGWARYFLSSTQGGKCDGTGYVMLYRGTAESRDPEIGKFAICQHQKDVPPTAQPMVGWHPGKCKLCGLDLTVDSSG